MFANGKLPDAWREAAVNVSSLSDLVNEGYDAVCSCTSCSMALRREYPELFDFEGISVVADSTSEAIECLRINDNLESKLG